MQIRLTPIALTTMLAVASCDLPSFDSEEMGVSEMTQAELGMEEQATRGRFCQVVQNLDLDEAQLLRVKDLYGAAETDLADVRDALLQLREEMQALWTQEQPSKAAIREKHQEMQTYQSQMFERRITFVQDVLALLQTAQRQSFNEQHGNTCTAPEEEVCQQKNEEKRRGGGGLSNMPDLTKIGEIMSLRDTMKEEMMETKAELQALKAEMCALWADGEIDVEAIRQKVEEMSVLRGQMMERMVDFRIQVTEIMGDQMRERMNERIQERREARQQRQSHCAFLEE